MGLETLLRAVPGRLGRRGQGNGTKISEFSLKVPPQLQGQFFSKPRIKTAADNHFNPCYVSFLLCG
jgi:hypothetical protein